MGRGRGRGRERERGRRERQSYSVGKILIDIKVRSRKKSDYIAVRKAEREQLNISPEASSRSVSFLRIVAIRNKAPPFFEISSAAMHRLFTFVVIRRRGILISRATLREIQLAIAVGASLLEGANEKGEKEKTLRVTRKDEAAYDPNARASDRMEPTTKYIKGP